MLILCLLPYHTTHPINGASTRTSTSMPQGPMYDRSPERWMSLLHFHNKIINVEFIEV